MSFFGLSIIIVILLLVFVVAVAIVVAIVLLLVKHRNRQRQGGVPGQLVPCPHCSESVEKLAQVCKFCGADLTASETEAEPREP